MGDEPMWIRAIRRTKGGARIIAKYQKPKAEGAGERLPDFVHVTGNEYFRLDQINPRAYVKCIGAEGQVTWWYQDPLGHWAVTGAKHSAADEPCDGCLAIEEDDGTLTIDGEINNVGPYDVWWRGTLRRGVWEGRAIYPEKSQAVE